MSLIKSAYELFQLGFYCFLKVAFWTIYKFYNRLKVIDASKMPEKGGVLVASSHASHIDPSVLGVALGRKLTFIARDGLFTMPVIGTIVGFFSIPINRENPQPSTIKETVRRLRRGEAVVLFPGGTRGSTDIKRGVGFLAVMSGAPVVPVRIEGSGQAMGRGSNRLRPARITVTVGDPIKVAKGGEEELEKELQVKLFSDIMEVPKGGTG